MTPFHFRTHFTALLVAVLILYTPAIGVDVQPFGKFWFYFGFIGLLHSLCIVVALRLRKGLAKKLIFLIATFFLAMLAPAIYVSMGFLSEFAPKNDAFGWIFIISAFGAGSAIAAFLYGYLIRTFWWGTLPMRAIVVTALVCGAGSLIAFTIGSRLLPYWLNEHFPTVLWWLMFSISLFMQRKVKVRLEPLRYLRMLRSRQVSALNGRFR